MNAVLDVGVGQKIKICCPAHADNNPSMDVTKNDAGLTFVRCWAGCTGDAIGKALHLDPHAYKAGESWITIFPNGYKMAKREAGAMSVADFAIAKKLDIQSLYNYNVGDIPEGIEFNYFDSQGKCLGKRIRRSMNDTVIGIKGCPTSIYGLWRINNWNEVNIANESYTWMPEIGRGIIVEGESDCLTLWQHSYQALGVPGATNYKKLELSHVAHWKRLYIWQESDKAGEAFVRNVAKHLTELGYTGKVFTVWSDKYKDVSDWHKADKDFKKAFGMLLKDATPIEELLTFADPDITEFKVANQLCAKYGEDMRYVKGKGWHFWNGAYYDSNDGKFLDTLQGHLAHLKDSLPSIPSPSLRTKTKGKVLGFETNSKLEALQKLCARICHEEVEVFNADPLLFNVQNGTVDLRNGELKPHSKMDRITKTANVVYDQSATCPRWQQFIDEITVGRKDLARLLQQAIGLSLTGVPVKKVFFCHGDGDNGKSLLVYIVSKLMGFYANTISIDSLCVRKGESIPNDIARLPAVRYLYTSETEQGKRFNESLLKQITGGTKITARFMKGEWFDFLPSFKLFVDGNHKPRIVGTDKGIWNRLVLIPFDAKFIDPSEITPADIDKGCKVMDKQLGEKLSDELSGILNWAIAGCHDYIANGLIIPEVCRLANEEYQTEQDTFGNFIRERVKATKGERTTLDSAFLAYRSWAEANNVDYIYDKYYFGRVMVDKGYKRDAGRRYWLDIQVADDWQRA